MGGPELAQHSPCGLIRRTLSPGPAGHTTADKRQNTAGWLELCCGSVGSRNTYGKQEPLWEAGIPVEEGHICGKQESLREAGHTRARHAARPALRCRRSAAGGRASPAAAAGRGRPGRVTSRRRGGEGAGTRVIYSGPRDGKRKWRAERRRKGGRKAWRRHRHHHCYYCYR